MYLFLQYLLLIINCKTCNAVCLGTHIIRLLHKQNLTIVEVEVRSRGPSMSNPQVSFQVTDCWKWCYIGGNSQDFWETIWNCTKFAQHQLKFLVISCNTETSKNHINLEVLSSSRSSSEVPPKSTTQVKISSLRGNGPGVDIKIGHFITQPFKRYGQIS